MDIPLQEVHGPEAGDLLVLSWGGTYGAVGRLSSKCQAEGLSVSHAHLRYLNPFPANLGESWRTSSESWSRNGTWAS